MLEIGQKVYFIKEYSFNIDTYIITAIRITDEGLLYIAITDDDIKVENIFERKRLFLTKKDAEDYQLKLRIR